MIQIVLNSIQGFERLIEEKKKQYLVIQGGKQT